MSAAKLPWLRLYVEIIDNEKLRLLAFEDRWHYVAILCCKRAGILDAGDAPTLLRRKLAVKLGLAARELEAMADRLAELSLIDAATFQPTGWDDHQFQSDTDPSAADRKRRQRARQKGEVTDKSRVTGTDVTRTDLDTDLDIEKPLRQGRGTSNGKGKNQGETPLQAAIEHAHYLFRLDNNAEARDAAIKAAHERHGATA